MNVQEVYGNNYERTVVGSEGLNPTTHAREIARYKYASKFIRSGMKVLEIGCSSGFGTTILPKDIYYTGIDYDTRVVQFANATFPGNTFICSPVEDFLNSIDFKYDIIIAFEVLEHIHNGIEVAQRLKDYCDTLVISTPYKEPPGLWGEHHVLHHLKEIDFPEFDYKYMAMAGAIRNRPDLNEPNLLLMQWSRGNEYPKKKTVLCSIPTKNRYDSLFNCLQSVALQTVKPDKVIIYDDGEHRDLTKDTIGIYQLQLLYRHGIDWEILFMPGKGQHIAHECANMAGFDYVWRMDDDGVAEPDVLERLLKYMDDPQIGAVGGAVYEVGKKIPTGTSQILDFFSSGNMQWAPDQGIHEVDWLYSSFLYRAGIVHYKYNMSPVAFHEESIFTHRLRRAGYTLIVDTTIHTYHFKAPKGGTRDADLKWAYEWDNKEFHRIMEEEWGIKLITLMGGIGDNFAFLNILPKLKEKYEHVIIGTAYPDIFKDQGVKVIPCNRDMTNVGGDIYSWMAEHCWKGSLVEAFEGLYL